jgi:hypothetical protein
MYLLASSGNSPGGLVTDRPLVRDDRPSPGVAVLTVDSPPRNAFGPAEGAEFFAAVDLLDADPDVRCVVVTGTGSAFLAGGDLRLQQTLVTREQQETYADHPHSLSAAMRRVEEMRMPVIAAINGDVAGGGLEFALCCDIRLAARPARFVAAGVNVGLILSWYRLPRTIGMGRAKEMLLTGAVGPGDRRPRTRCAAAGGGRARRADRLAGTAQRRGDQGLRQPGVRPDDGGGRPRAARTVPRDVRDP